VEYCSGECGNTEVPLEKPGVKIDLVQEKEVFAYGLAELVPARHVQTHGHANAIMFIRPGVPLRVVLLHDDQTGSATGMTVRASTGTSTGEGLLFVLACCCVSNAAGA
jgi:hypothetical protein